MGQEDKGTTDDGLVRSYTKTLRLLLLSYCKQPMPQCEEMPAGRGLGKCQVGVVKRRGVCVERNAPPGGGGG